MTELAHDFDFHPVLVTRSLDAGVGMFAGKWKLSILWYLEQRPRRFGELEALLQGVTPKVLSRQLRDLTDAGLISRVEIGGARQTQYALTESGMAAMPLLQILSDWGNWRLRRSATDHGAIDVTSSRR